MSFTARAIFRPGPFTYSIYRLIAFSNLPESKGLFSPRWSPDARFIVAMTAIMPPDSSELPATKLMLFDLSRQKWQEWFQAPSIAYSAFSRSGKYLYFSDSSAGFYRVRLGDNKVERVAQIDVPGEMTMDDFWYWTGLAPDVSPMFLRDTSTREIYALDVGFP